MSKTKSLFKLFSLLLLALLSFGLIACGETDADIAAKVDEIIEELPAEITLDDELVLIEARDAYEALTAEQKELVENLAKLEAKETKLENLKAAELVITKIKGLPANLVLAHKTLVTGARNSYDELTAEQKALVTNYDKLEEAEETMETLEAEKADRDAAKEVENLIAALPGPGGVELEHEDAIVAARAAYDALNAGQKELVPNLTKLVNVENELADLIADEIREANKAAALVVDTMIANLPVLVLLEDKADVEAARAAYEALTTDQKVFVINLMHLEAKEQRLVDLAVAKPVEDLINALPEEVTVEDEDAIVAARAAYDALDSDIKKLVTNLDRLVQKEDELLIAKDPDLAALYQLKKSVPTQILDDYVLPTEGGVTWAYKADSDKSFYNLETGEILKNSFDEALVTFVATKGEATLEFEINFGFVSEDQTAIFYTGTTIPEAGPTWEGNGTFYTQLEKAGFGGFTIIVDNKVYFIGKDTYIPLTAEEDGAVIDRETLRPLEILGTIPELNNNGIVNGKANNYSGAGALYHNTSDHTITFNASDTYGRLNVASLGWAKLVFKLNADGTYTVQPGLADQSSDGNAEGTTGTVMVTLEPGDMLWTPHSWEIDYDASGNSKGFGTKLHQNFNGVLEADKVIEVKKFKNLLPQDEADIAIELLKAELPATIMNDYQLPTLEGLVWTLKDGEDDTIFDIEEGKLLRFVGENEKLVLIATYEGKEYEVELTFGIIDPTLQQFYYDASDSHVSQLNGTFATQEARAGFGGYTIIVDGKQFFLGENAYIPLSAEEENTVITQKQLRPHGEDERAHYNGGLVTGGVASPNLRGYGVLYENTGEVPIKFDLSHTYGRNNSSFAGYGKIVFLPEGDGNYKVTAHLADTGTNDTTNTTEETMFVLNPGEMLWAPHTWETGGTYLFQPKAGYEKGVLAVDAIIQVVKFKTEFAEVEE